MSDAVPLRRVATNGIHLEVAEAGPEGGPLAILLHGFPEPWAGWRHQIGPLAAAGYRVVAPTQRGYGGSDRPRGVAAYHLDELVADLLGLIDAYGRERAVLVGHDWGGIVAWAAIERHPDRFERAVILNAPHPAAMQATLRSDFKQMLRSWYVFTFQLPFLPERLLARRDFRPLERAMTSTARPGAFDPADFEAYRAAWRQPGALRSMIHWYRAAARAPRWPAAAAPIAVPTLLIWGVLDHALGPELARLSYARCRSARLEWLDDATHWVAHEEPDRVNRLILDFLGPPALS